MQRAEVMLPAPTPIPLGSPGRWCLALGLVAAVALVCLGGSPGTRGSWALRRLLRGCRP